MATEQQRAKGEPIAGMTIREARTFIRDEIELDRSKPGSVPLTRDELCAVLGCVAGRDCDPNWRRREVITHLDAAVEGSVDNHPLRRNELRALVVALADRNGL